MDAVPGAPADVDSVADPPAVVDSATGAPADVVSVAGVPVDVDSLVEEGASSVGSGSVPDAAASAGAVAPVSVPTGAASEPAEVPGEVDASFAPACGTGSDPPYPPARSAGPAVLDGGGLPDGTPGDDPPEPPEPPEPPDSPEPVAPDDAAPAGCPAGASLPVALPCGGVVDPDAEASAAGGVAAVVSGLASARGVVPAAG
ncbi:MAG TPA: hypothetical protein VFJ16_16100 [Longimicrobium sp.]|nr:hypothetical protein [Longimicrobium sp.]